VLLARAVASLLLAAAPALAAALEPRFDHRDTHGPSLEVLVAHDTVARSGRASVSSLRPAARLAWGFDPLGEGNEVLVGAALALRSLDDPGKRRVLLALDARYRSYFGTEEAKTFLDLGIWAPLRSPLAAGPLVGLGGAWDFSRYVGVHLAAAFSTAFGEARVASFSLSVGTQIRFDLP
jgi:hypothetical protein